MSTTSALHAVPSLPRTTTNPPDQTQVPDGLLRRVTQWCAQAPGWLVRGARHVGHLLWDLLRGRGRVATMATRAVTAARGIGAVSVLVAAATTPRGRDRHQGPSRPTSPITFEGAHPCPKKPSSS